MAVRIRRNAIGGDASARRVCRLQTGSALGDITPVFIGRGCIGTCRRAVQLPSSFSQKAVIRGILFGLLIALAQSTLSTACLRWSWSRSYFYWVWGAGVLFRLGIFALTAYVVHWHTELPLVATLLSMVLATTLLLVVESLIFLKPRHK